jgi:peptidyl-prolyl cis-trans isomerase B (cyclophilin B)
MKVMKKIVIVILALVMALALGLSACGDADNGGKDVNNDSKPKVEITMKDGGTILLELDRDTAPKTVANFLKLVDEGFYDGLTFHRVIPDFMIQGGDPDGTGMGGSDETVEGEFSQNGVENNISHVRGVISMARSKDPNSASSQFFITNANYPSLDGSYAAFGTVIEGMDVVDKISEVDTDENDKPLMPVVIETIKVI